MNELPPHTAYDGWLNNELVEDLHRDEENRIRIAALFGVAVSAAHVRSLNFGEAEVDQDAFTAPGDIKYAEQLRLRMMTDPITQRIYTDQMHVQALETEKHFSEVNNDKLTSILNDQGLERWLRAQFQLPETEDSDRRLSNLGERDRRALVIFGDLCNFRLINDLYGHKNADELLKYVAKTIPQQMQLRQTDAHAIARITRARLHGDEYVAVAHGIDEDDAELLFERLHESQRAKLDNPHAQAFWARARLVATKQEAHTTALREVVDPETNTVTDMFLQLGDLELPVSEAAVVSYGKCYGEVTSLGEFDRLKDIADENTKTTKRELHEMMSGAYRSFS